MTRLKVYDIYEENEYYINISSFAIKKEDFQIFIEKGLNHFFKATSFIFHM